jgi:hypothetical protein
MITKKTGYTLQSEYDLAKQENEDSNDNDDKWTFCSDLDEIEIALPWMKLKLLCPWRTVVTMSWSLMKVPPRHKQKLLQRR